MLRVLPWLLVAALSGCIKDWDELERLAERNVTDASEDGSDAAEREGPDSSADAAGTDASGSAATDAAGTDASGSGAMDGGADAASMDAAAEAGGAEVDAGADAAPEAGSDSAVEGGTSDASQRDGAADSGEVDACVADPDACATVVCGDGVLGGTEECDDGGSNSDTAPNACRTSCVAAHCGDGVVDTGEQCDEGMGNSDSVADACRTNCTPPRCGDQVTDSDEECDDGNLAWGDNCYECSERHYFVLNAPSTASQGDDSIVRFDMRGNRQVILGPDTQFNGTRELAMAPDGSVLYAVQSHFSLMQHRIMIVDPVGGGLIDQIRIDESVLGYSPSSTMALGINGLLYILARDTPNNLLRMMTVDPETEMIAEVASFPSTATLDMTRDKSGNFYLSGSGSVFRITPAYDSYSTFADSSDGLTSPYGLAYDEVNDEIWVADSATLGALYRFGRSSGSGSQYATFDGLTQPQLRGLMIDIDGLPLVCIGTQDKIVKVDASGNSTDVWTQDIDYPVDIKMIDLSGL